MMSVKIGQIFMSITIYDALWRNARPTENIRGTHIQLVGLWLSRVGAWSPRSRTKTARLRNAGDRYKSNDLKAYENCE